jgi:hypothetical protein
MNPSELPEIAFTEIDFCGTPFNVTGEVPIATAPGGVDMDDVGVVGITGMENVAEGAEGTDVPEEFVAVTVNV